MYQIIQFKTGTEVMGEGKTLDEAIADALDWGADLPNDIPALPIKNAIVGAVYWRFKFKIGSKVVGVPTT